MVERKKERVKGRRVELRSIEREGQRFFLEFKESRTGRSRDIKKVVVATMKDAKTEGIQRNADAGGGERVD